MASAVAAPSSAQPRLRGEQSASQPGRLRTAWAVGGCVVLALLLRAPYLSAPPGRDEGGVAYIARNWPAGHGSL